MSAREHRTLRLVGIVLLVLAAVWPSSRARRTAGAPVALTSHRAVTTAARFSIAEPRPRAPVTLEGPAPEGGDDANAGLSN